MPKKTKKNDYFGKEQEKAVIDWQNAKTLGEKNAIYTEKLYQPFSEMVDGLIQKYANMTSKEGEEREELHSQMLIHIYENLHKFDYTMGYKAYSYFGTIANHFRKNYEKKRWKNNIKSNDIDEYDQDMISTIMSKDHVDLEDDEFNENLNIDFINDFCKKIRYAINETENMKDYEVKVGEALIVFFKNHREIFPNEIDVRSVYDSTGKILKVKSINNYAKNKIFYELKEITNLNDKYFRLGLKFYREKYDFVKNYFLKEYLKTH